MRIRSGYLATKILLQRAVTEQDASGQPVKRWEDVSSVWANVTDMSGREFIASSTLNNTVQTKITVRYRNDIVPAMRVVHKADIYQIEAVLGQDKLSLLLMCSRRAEADS